MSSAVPVAMTSEAVAWEFYNICRNPSYKEAGGSIDAYYSYRVIRTDVSLVFADYILACYTGNYLLLFMTDKIGVVPARNSVIETQMELVKLFNSKYELCRKGNGITVKNTEDESEITPSVPPSSNEWYSIVVPLNDIKPIRLNTKPLTFADMEGVL